MRGEFIDLGEAQLYYYASGSRGGGDPLLLVHGFPASSYLWAPLVPLVPPGHRVLVPDLLGFGRSDPETVGGVRAARTLDFSTAAHADRLVRLLDALHVDRLCAVGHGVGAAVVLAMQAAVPDRITRLCLVNPVTADLWPTAESGALKRALPIMQWLPSSLIAAAVRWRLLNQSRASAGLLRASQQFLRPFRDRAGRATLLAHLRSLSARPTQPTTTPATLVPVAIISGDRDRLLPRDRVERLHEQMSGSTLDFVSGGHFSPTESPEQVANVLRDLLARSVSG